MKKRIDALDSLKGIACCVIAFTWHYLNMQNRNENLPFYSVIKPFYLYGQYFVELFFMLSGFGMAYGYREKIEQGMKFQDYLQRRFKHIYPLFLSTLLITLFLQASYERLYGWFYNYVCDFYHLILNVFCIQYGWIDNCFSFNGPAWCISVEFFCYICFFFTTQISLVRSREPRQNRGETYVIICLLMVLIGLAILVRGCTYPFINMGMARGISCFYIGVLVCEFDRRFQKEQKTRFANIIFGWSIFVIVMMRLLAFSFWGNELEGQLSVIIIVCPAVIFIAVNHRLCRKLLEVRVLRYIGRLSMFIYLWHVPCQIGIKIADKIALGGGTGLQFQKRLDCLYCFRIVSQYDIVHGGTKDKAAL